MERIKEEEDIVIERKVRVSESDGFALKEGDRCPYCGKVMDDFDNLIEEKVKNLVNK